jgi:hexokinase
LIGHEKGHYLALDLGGTNLRVVLVTLEGQGKFKTISTKARVSEDLKTGPMRNLCGKNHDIHVSLPTVTNLHVSEQNTLPTALTSF